MEKATAAKWKTVKAWKTGKGTRAWNEHMEKAIAAKWNAFKAWKNGKGTRASYIFFFFVHLSLLIMTNPNQLCEVLLFVCFKMTDETNLSSKLPVADRTREV